MRYEEAKEICQAAFADAVKLGAGDVERTVAMMASTDTKLTEALHIVATQDPPPDTVANT